MAASSSSVDDQQFLTNIACYYDELEIIRDDSKEYNLSKKQFLGKLEQAVNVFKEDDKKLCCETLSKLKRMGVEDKELTDRVDQISSRHGLTLRKHSSPKDDLSGVTIEDMPSEIKFTILDSLRDKWGKLDAYSLESMATISQEWEDLSTEAMVMEANHFKPLYHLGFYGATCAIRFAIKHKLHSINLQRVEGITDSHINQLLENNPNLKRLSMRREAGYLRNVGEDALFQILKCKDLEYLALDNFWVKKIPPLPKKLRHLKLLSCCYLEECPTLPETLISFVCTFGRFKSLPPLPGSLKKIVLSGCDYIEKLPKLPNLLEDLSLVGCKKLTIPSILPVGLLSFDCSQSLLENLPIIPKGVLELRCSSCTNLRNLGNLPPTLLVLESSFCESLSIPQRFPDTLKILKVNNCNITRQIILPPLLEQLEYSGGDGIKTLPELPESLKHLSCFCFYNLVSIRQLPSHLEYLCIDLCKNLVSIPELPKPLNSLSSRGCSKLDKESLERVDRYKKYRKEIKARKKRLLSLRP